MNTKHTPGPWHVSVHNYGMICIKAPEGHPHKTLAAIGYDNSKKNDELLTNNTANARLIAAAPELLAELEGIVTGWNSVEKHVRPLTPWELERRKFIKEIICKATGKE